VNDSFIKNSDEQDSISEDDSEELEGLEKHTRPRHGVINGEHPQDATYNSMLPVGKTKQQFNLQQNNPITQVQQNTITIHHSTTTVCCCCN
jgi:hypothetical protein